MSLRQHGCSHSSLGAVCHSLSAVCAERQSKWYFRLVPSTARRRRRHNERAAVWGAAARSLNMPLKMGDGSASRVSRGALTTVSATSGHIEEGPDDSSAVRCGHLGALPWHTRSSRVADAMIEAGSAVSKYTLGTHLRRDTPAPQWFQASGAISSSDGHSRHFGVTNVEFQLSRVKRIPYP
jgi:hypothetical protein